jgi:diacylglycerol kinase family enzyme
MSGLAVIVNAASGIGAASRVAEIAEQMARAGRDGTITEVRRSEALGRVAARVLDAGCDALVAAGGDGTVNALASVAIGGDVPLGILPLGTLNHFAKDLGIPLELEEAMKVILAGRTCAVDVGEVNGRVFLNNASLGVYPRIVQLREQYRGRGLGKWLAALWAALAVLRRRSFMNVRIRTQDENIVRHTPLVLVGNNAYHTTGLAAGSRSSLNQGLLALYVMNVGSRAGLLRQSWEIWRKGAGQVRELDSLMTEDAVIEAARPAIRATLDGELLVLRTPLRCRCRPGGLRVLVP